MAKKKAKKKKAKTRKPAAKKRRVVRQTKGRPKRRSRTDGALEEGLRETFPASDPPAPTDPTRSIRE